MSQPTWMVAVFRARKQEDGCRSSVMADPTELEALPVEYRSTRIFTNVAQAGAYVAKVNEAIRIHELNPPAGGGWYTAIANLEIPPSFLE